MAFTKASFQPIGGQGRRGDAPQMFSYKTEDSAADLDTAGYFNEVRHMLEIGDVILRVTLSSGALSTTGFHVVKDKSATAVDVTDTLALTMTDTD